MCIRDRCVDSPATDVDAMVAWACENSVDFVVVAPDDPLALGMVEDVYKRQPQGPGHPRV